MSNDLLKRLRARIALAEAGDMGHFEAVALMREAADCIAKSDALFDELEAYLEREIMRRRSMAQMTAGDLGGVGIE